MNRWTVARAVIAASLAAAALLAPAGCGRPDPAAPSATAPAGEPAAPKAEGATAAGPVAVVPHPVLGATFTVSWSEPERAPLDAPAAAGYAVAVGYDGPLGRANWRRTARVLEIVPAGGRAYARTYGPGTPGVVAGAAAWLTVVPVDRAGEPGAIGGSVAFRVTDGFVIEGRVVSDQGAPLGDVAITVPGHGPVASTAADGVFRTAPLLAGQAFELRTDAGDGWYDYTTPPVGAGAPAPVICLIDRTPLQFPLVGVDTKMYLGAMTRWFYHNVGSTRPFVRWSAFPLRVHIAEGRNDAGTLDLAALTREQLAYLNATAGRELWVETTDSTQAHVRVRYLAMASFLGRTVLNPDEAHPVWGNTTPRWMRMVLDPELATESAARFLLNHELGHTLYIGQHSTNANHLMWYQGGVAPGLPSADDLRLFRAVATIPVGTDYNRYEE